jgi:hypothetical protein
MADDKMRKVFESPKCAECGAPLEQQRASYSGTRRFYCEQCSPVGKVKETWQPLMAGSSVSAVYILDENGKIVPAKRN